MLVVVVVVVIAAVLWAVAMLVLSAFRRPADATLELVREHNRLLELASHHRDLGEYVEADRAEQAAAVLLEIIRSREQRGLDE